MVDKSRYKFLLHNDRIYQSESYNFDLTTSVILAAYSFDAYNEPTTGKTAKGLDKTSITFTSADFIRQSF